jgi:glucose-6-phosphate 1-dehydrogenase
MMATDQLEPQDLIIFGATGDLARTKLLPAVFRLHLDSKLPHGGRIIGAARRPRSDDSFAGFAHDAVRRAMGHVFDEEAWRVFAERLSYVTLGEGGFRELARQAAHKRPLIYLALPPSAFEPIIQSLQREGLNRKARIVIEKPFGRDLQSALQLDRLLHEAFDESQIFRIDHYLGKETVQNIMVLRFGNSVFERLWNRDAVDHIEITAAESEGIGERGSFYEETGALRDIVQNHVLQMLALLMMEPPSVFDAEAIRDEKLKLLRAVLPVTPADVIRGQYTAGSVQGEEARGYRQEEGVDPRSQTETYAALKVSINNWRWAGVPVFLRTGKRLPQRKTEVEVAFKPVPTTFFENTSVRPRPNHLTIAIQPSEHICLSFVAKVPGPQLLARQAQMTFEYSNPNDGNADAYERLLSEALDGDSTMFVRDDSIERAWQILQPALDAPPPVRFYEAGSWGPAEADALIAPEQWHVNE